jgi:hypothetical protein
MAKAQAPTPEEVQLDFSKWNQIGQGNTEEIDKIENEEAAIIGKIQMLQDRLESIKMSKQGMLYANKAAMMVIQEAQESFKNINEAKTEE